MFVSTCAPTFWICDVCSFSAAVSRSICSCCFATVVCKSFCRLAAVTLGLLFFFAARSFQILEDESAGGLGGATLPWIVGGASTWCGDARCGQRVLLAACVALTVLHAVRIGRTRAAFVPPQMNTDARGFKNKLTVWRFASIRF